MMQFDPIEEVIADVRRGRMVVIFDDKDRENEGDLMVAAEMASTDNIHFMVQHGRGLICLSLTGDRLKLLGIPPQTADNTTPFGTNFTVSIDHKNVSGRGASAEARAYTMRRAVAEDARADEFVQPGFVFPLNAMSGGVLRRPGQTEGSVDLARLAGLKPAGVICEIMADDGTMPSGQALQEYCRKLKLKATSVRDIAEYKLRHEVCLRKVAECEFSDYQGLGLPVPLVNLSSLPKLKVVVYVDDADEREHLAFVVGQPSSGSLVRIHSECLTGDVFGSLRCDCGDQFIRALIAMIEAESGVLVYLHQEGRGIGLANKIRAYELQDSGLDTVDANLELGFGVDQRDYRLAAQIISDLGLSEITLMTNNPHKVAESKRLGLKVSRQVAIPVPINQHNRSYLKTKSERLGHKVLEFPGDE